MQQLRIGQADHQASVVEIEGKLANHPVSILIDLDLI
jgi:hypothetical protein